MGPRFTIRSLIVPEIQLNAAYATAFVAILGTTISPYHVLLAAGQEIEEQHRHHAQAPVHYAHRRAPVN